MKHAYTIYTNTEDLGTTLLHSGWKTTLASAPVMSYFLPNFRHVKFWYLEYSRSKYKEPVPLMGRSAILGEQRNNYFCDVACGRGEMGDSTYAITKSGLLCEFNNRRLLDKWVELRVSAV